MDARGLGSSDSRDTLQLPRSCRIRTSRRQLVDDTLLMRTFIPACREGVRGRPLRAMSAIPLPQRLSRFARANGT